jgi:hypothetical protein
MSGRKLLVIALLIALAAPVVAATPAPQGKSSLDGRVLASDGKTPVAGATVRACYLEGGTSAAGSPSNAKGAFRLEGLNFGFADLTIETADGLFVVNQVLQFLPDDRLTADFVLTKYAERPAEWWSARDKRTVPCAAGEPIGSADMRAGRSAGQFFKSPAGIAVIAGAAGLLVLLAVSGGDDDESPSPSQP